MELDEIVEMLRNVGEIANNAADEAEQENEINCAVLKAVADAIVDRMGVIYMMVDVPDADEEEIPMETQRKKPTQAVKILTSLIVALLMFFTCHVVYTSMTAVDVKTKVIYSIIAIVEFFIMALVR